MTPDERRQLARTLADIDLQHPLMDPRLRRRRRFGLLFMTVCCLALAAWIAILVLTLAYGSHGFTTSLVSAVVVELPLAALLFTSARRLIRVTIQTMMQLSGITGPVPPLWRIPLFAHGLEEALPARLRPRDAPSWAHVGSDVTATGGSSS